MVMMVMNMVVIIMEGHNLVMTMMMMAGVLNEVMIIIMGVHLIFSIFQCGNNVTLRWIIIMRW